jgi:hypothetical protein
MTASEESLETAWVGEGGVMEVTRAMMGAGGTGEETLSSGWW